MTRTRVWWIAGATALGVAPAEPGGAGPVVRRRRRDRSLRGRRVDAEPARAWSGLVSAPARALALGARSHGRRLSRDGPRLPRARAGADQAAGGGMVPD